MKKLLLFSSIVSSATLFLCSAGAQSYNFLDPEFLGFGANIDGSIRPGDQAYVTTGSFQRGLAYNPATGNLIFIDRQAGGGGTNIITGSIYVLWHLDEGLAGFCRRQFIHPRHEQRTAVLLHQFPAHRPAHHRHATGQSGARPGWADGHV